MICPYQTIETIEYVKSMTIGRNDLTITKKEFAECSIGDCPYYINRAGKDCCKRVEIENRGGKQ